jgi:hypothetical protein
LRHTPSQQMSYPCRYRPGNPLRGWRSGGRLRRRWFGPLVSQERELWNSRTWRPITMLVFVALIVAQWLGWSAPNLSQCEALKLWDIVEIGLGGT